MAKVQVTIATGDYEHFRDFMIGKVQAEGIDPVWMDLDVHEIFTRFIAWREWQVSEMSFAKFTAQYSEPNPDIIAIPVFASRVFRLSSIYVNPSKGIRTAQDLKGKRVGVPEWAQTAAVYTRGWLQDDAGVPLDSIRWVQAGTEETDRPEKVELNLPKGVEIERITDKTLSGMLVSGELDAIMTASIPIPFVKKDPNIKRLFENPRAEEEAYLKRTGIWPIMHVIALRKDLLDAHPWVARNLYLAFDESKNRAMKRLFASGVSRYPMPWIRDTADYLKELFGGDFYPYGIEENRKTLEAFLRWSFEQGIAKRHMTPEEIFPEGINPSVKT
ncbi:MAG: ABC transporter substrate-binding protein [Beijerinckiaceae bacterium]